MFARACLTAAILAFGLRAAAAGEAVELKWGLEKGKTLRYKLADKAETNFELPDLSGFGGPKAGPQRTLTSLELEPDLEISAVKAGKDPQASVKAKYAAARFTVEVPARGSQSCDTDSEADKLDAQTDPFKRAFLALKGKVPFTFTWGSAAGVFKMSGHNRYVPSAFNPKAAKDPATAAAAFVCAEMLLDAPVEDLFADLLIPLPAEKVLPGDKWKGESSVLVYPLGVYLLKTEYVLKEIKDGKTAVISCTSEVTRKPDSETDFGLPAKEDPMIGFTKQVLKKLTLQGATRSGEFEFDLEKKELSKGTATMELTTAGKFDSPVGGTIDFKFTTKHVRSVERKP
ncbi:MAG: hypothetical protein MUC63_07440 [Planctomycetes bacterium]|jgi:hypothetical protein|nr:hypothetical protein [Planctomycetota bacterium]